MADDQSNPQGEPTGQKPLPKCKALLICDRVLMDAATGQPSIIGIVEQFRLSSYPNRLRPFYAFLQLMDGIGRYDVVVEIHDLQQDRVIGRGTGIGLNFPERLHRMNVVIPIPPLHLQHPGAYDLVVVANGQEIERQQFLAMEPPTETQNESQH